MNRLLLVLVFCAFCTGQAFFAAPPDTQGWWAMWGIVGALGAACILMVRR